MPKLKPIVTRNASELADFLGLSRAEGAEMEFRADLNETIVGIVKQKRITHAQLSQLAGTSRPRITNLLNGNTSDISTDLMLRVLAALGYKVECKISKAA
ncbi:MAG TPA: XRE family transcriptional regulator [Bdellovibrionota bacterium]|nr:XRE family transcriptional regulator [Bdellovibrionota bacterium]